MKYVKRIKLKQKIIMIRISKKVEYALLACRYLASKGDELAAVKEMSENLKVSYEFLAKTLQKLSKSGIAKSFQGVAGGYKLVKAPSSISVFEIIMAIEGKNAIVRCISRNGITCNGEECALQLPMAVLQSKFENILKTTKLTELIN